MILFQGAVDGMKELFNPDWSELSNLGVRNTPSVIDTCINILSLL